MGSLVFPEVLTNTETPETETPFLFRQELIFLPTFVLSKTSGALGHIHWLCMTVTAFSFKSKMSDSDQSLSGGRLWGSAPNSGFIVIQLDIQYFSRSDEYPCATLCQRTQHSRSSQDSFSLSFLQLYVNSTATAPKKKRQISPVPVAHSTKFFAFTSL